ncbi:MAG: hypothetical protein HQM16_02680 [Deltaproteobacteria bacterium]|nr:hypothetical protein [Deltaproteobacteria bacterium]
MNGENDKKKEVNPQDETIIIENTLDDMIIDESILEESCLDSTMVDIDAKGLILDPPDTHKASQEPKTKPKKTTPADDAENEENESIEAMLKKRRSFKYRLSQLFKKKPN